MGLEFTMNHELEKRLQQKITSMPKVVEVVKSNTASMQEQAQRLAPVDTGFLKRSIYQKVDQEGTKVVGEVGADAAYDAFQEYGTRFQPGKPHLRPAFYMQENKFKSDMERIAKE